jgi:predicted amidohydrolase
LRVSALELPARFDHVAEQLALVDSLLRRAPTDLALLPEASLTGYLSPRADFDLARFAEPGDGPTARALAALAKKHATLLVGPLVESSGGACYDAMIGFDAEGREVVRYRKRHPWYPETWASPGDAPHPVFAAHGLRVTIAVCFDVHFFAAERPAADLLLFPSAWVGDGKLEALRAAAAGMHAVNANWGAGEPAIEGQGDSCILHASGEVLARGGPRIDVDLGQ